MMGVVGYVEAVPPDFSANKVNVRKGSVRPIARVSPVEMMDVAHCAVSAIPTLSVWRANVSPAPVSLPAMESPAVEMDVAERVEPVKQVTNVKAVNAPITPVQMTPAPYLHKTAFPNIVWAIPSALQMQIVWETGSWTPPVKTGYASRKCAIAKRIMTATTGAWKPTQTPTVR